MAIIALKGFSEEMMETIFKILKLCVKQLNILRDQRQILYLKSNVNFYVGNSQLGMMIFYSRKFNKFE